MAHPRSHIATSIVIPAYNEARRMEQSLPRLVDSFSWDEEEVIVVDDGSTDDTLAVARRHLDELPGAQFIRLEENRGKGAAVRAGVARARGRIIAYTDADMASDPKGFGTLFAALAGSEVAIGSRALPQSTVNCRDPKRVFYGRAFNRFVRATTDLAVHDTQCGFKAFRGPAAKLLFHISKIDRYAFDVEVLVLARKLGMRVREIPVDWTDVSGSHVRPLLDSLPMAADVVRVVTDWRNGTPIEAVAIQSPTNGGRAMPAAVAEVLPHSLRYSDAVVSWPRGALVLLPCLDRETVSHVHARLAGKLPGCRVTQSSVTVEMLLHPSASPILEALRSLPLSGDTEQPIVCDQGTGSLLLTSLGVA